MTEVIASSRDPDQRQRRPLSTRPALLAALIAVVSVVGFLVTTQSHAGRPVHHSTAGPTVAPSPAPNQPAPEPGPVAPVGLRCGQHCDTPVLRGHAGHGPPGLRLLVNTVPLSVLDTTGNRHAGPRIPLRRGEHVENLLPLGDDAAALVQADYLTDSSPPGRVYRLTPTGTAVQIGRADALVQGVGATLWTITYPRQSTAASPGPFTLSEVDPTGRVIARVSEADGTQVLRATRAGLIAILPARPTGAFLAPQTLVLLDPVTGDVEHVLSTRVFALLDATDTTVAWSSVGSLVEVYDLVHQTSEVVFHPRGYLPPDHGRFSPDQRTLALSVGGLPQLGTNPASYGYVQVLDLRTGRTTRISGLRLPPKNDPQLDWSHDDGVLILGVEYGRQGRIAFWHAKSHMVTVLAATVPHSEPYRFEYLQLHAG